MNKNFLSDDDFKSASKYRAKGIEPFSEAGSAFQNRRNVRQNVKIEKKVSSEKPKKNRSYVRKRNKTKENKTRAKGNVTFYHQKADISPVKLMHSNIAFDYSNPGMENSQTEESPCNTSLPINYNKVCKSFKTTAKMMNFESESPHDKIKHHQKTTEGMLGDHIFHRISNSINTPGGNSSPNSDKMKELRLFSKDSDDSTYNYSDNNSYQSSGLKFTSNPRLETTQGSNYSKNTSYFSNKILASQLANSEMPVIPNQNHSDSSFYGGNKGSIHSNYERKAATPFVEDESSPDALNKKQRWRNPELASWGGHNYLSETSSNVVTNSNQQYILPADQTREKAGIEIFNNQCITQTQNMTQEAPKDNSKIQLINSNLIILMVDKDGKMQPNFQSDTNYESDRPQAPNKRTECKSRAEHDVVQMPHNMTQSNYYSRMDEPMTETKKRFSHDKNIMNAAAKKAVKSSSFSPTKHRGFKRTENKFMLKQGNDDDEYKDEDYAWFRADMNQTQEQISTYSSMTKKSRRQRIINKSVHCTKNSTKCVCKSCLKNSGSGVKTQSNSRNCNKNAVNITNNPPQFSFKSSKMKKRLKFTLRNERQRQNQLYERQASKEDKMFDINDIVSIVGINNRQAKPTNIPGDHKIVISKPEIIKEKSHKPNLKMTPHLELEKRNTKSENRTANIPQNGINKSSYYKSDSCSPPKIQNIKRAYQTNVMSNQALNEVGGKNRLNTTHLQPPDVLRSSSNSDGQKSAGLPSSMCLMPKKPQANNYTNGSLKPVSISQCLSESPSRLKTHHKMYKNNCTVITDCSGPRVCQNTQTKRLCMKRRQEMHNAPLIIVCFDGVIGNTISSSSYIEGLNRLDSYYRQTKEDELMLRQAVGKSLRYLMGSFQVVLFMQKYRKKQDNMVGMIEGKIGDVFDAIYTRCSYKNDNTVIDYSQIYDDFSIREEEIESKIAVLCPLNMELEEVKERDREELLFLDNSLGYPYKHIAAQCLPISKGPYGNPLSILITSLNTQSSRITTFGRVSKLLNLMMNVYEDDSCKSSSQHSSEGEEQFSFVKSFKNLQNMIISKHVNVKSALFTTNKISQAVNKKVQKEEAIEKFRESKMTTYSDQKEHEDILPINNAYLNLRNQNVHTLRHITQYYNDFYYDIIEKQEEDDLDSRQSCNIIEVEITHRNGKSKSNKKGVSSSAAYE